MSDLEKLARETWLKAYGCDRGKSSEAIILAALQRAAAGGIRARRMSYPGTGAGKGVPANK